LELDPNFSSEKNMRKVIFSIAFLWFGLSQLIAQTSSEKLYQPAVLIELFSSEGCGSCPFADQFLKEVIHISDSSKSPVYVIDYHVVIWNKSGWVDPFSDSAYSLRQQEYVYRKNLKALYTPMVFINGSDKDYAGGDKRGIGMAIQSALSKPSKHYLRSRVTGVANEDSLLIAYQTWGNIDSMQLMAAFVQKEINSQVKGGENAGLVLHHHNVVRGIFTQHIKTSEGMFKIPVNADLNLENFRIVLFLQHKRTWEVVATDQLNFSFKP
jgi:hypothetical protein